MPKNKDLNYTDLNYTQFEYEYSQNINNPIVCLLRLRELLCPVGYVDADKMKKLVCDFIDDSGIVNFSTDY